jgi:glutamyl-tRNA synthetase
MPLADLLPLVKTELKANKLWREEYDTQLAAVTATIDSTHAQAFESLTEMDDRPEAIAVHLPEIGSHEWYVKTVDLIRARFFTLKDFSTQGRAYFSEDFDFDTAAVEKNLKKFPDLQNWLPELADVFEAKFGVAQLPYTEADIEIVVKDFTEEKGTKLGVIMNGARTLLTGVAVGPSMLSVFEIIGLDRSVMRLRSQVAWN